MRSGWPHVTAVLGLCLSSLLFTGCNRDASSKAWQLEVYDPASNTSRRVGASDASNKLVVINYWAEWCKPCLLEIPELNAFASANQDRLLMFSVNFDNKQGPALQEALEKTGMALPAITSNIASIFTLPDITGLPTTLVLDQNGQVQEQLLGPQTRDSLQAALSRHAGR